MKKHWDKKDYEVLKQLITKYGKQKIAETAIEIDGRRGYLETMGEKYVAEDKQEKYQWSVFDTCRHEETVRICQDGFAGIYCVDCNKQLENGC